VERREETFAPVRPSLVLEGGDRLTFVGNAELVVDLQRRRGLRLADVEGFDDPSHRHHTFVEAVIGPSSKLVNSTLRQADFRARYQAAVVAIHRSGQRVTGKLGSVRLRPGDTLLLLAGEDFPTRWRNREDFLLVAHLGGTAPAATRYAPIAIAVLVGLIAVPALGLLSLFKTALLGAGALVVTGVLRPREARDAIDLNVVILIGAAFGLGAALESTGLAARLADLVQDAMSWAGRPGSVLGVVVVTMVLTELITNAGAVVLAYPIAVAVAAEIGVDPRLAALAVAAAGSASFITPVGYQTNTMVYGPGGYRFTDYARLGLPLSVLVAATITVAVLAWS
jgi:di/tricarboxylate transporter